MSIPCSLALLLWCWRKLLLPFVLLLCFGGDLHMCLTHFRLAVYYWIAVYTLGIKVAGK